MKINELDNVVLTRHLDEYNLTTGTVGTVVHKYNESNFEVEFMDAIGTTVGILTLKATDIRPVNKGEMFRLENEHSGKLAL